MSKKEKQLAGAMRIFEALSGVDEELLIRCEAKKQVRPIWYYGKVLAACLCFVVMGALLWSVRPIMESASKSSGSVDMAPATAIGAPEAAMEAAACENETALEGAVGEGNVTAEQDNGSGAYDAEEAGNTGSGFPDAVTESKQEDTEFVKQESAKSESANKSAITNTQQDAIPELSGSKESVTSDVTQENAPLDKRKELVMKDAKAVPVLGEYVPTEIPTGYFFESAWLTESNITGDAERVSLCWVNGMDDIHITISYAAEDVTTVDVSKTETYDVHQYEIPYASTVPEEYRSVFNNPVFAAENFTQDIVEMRMKSVADAGDTATPRGNFGILYDSGVLVEFSGDGDAESIYEMMVSGK